MNRCHPFDELNWQTEAFVEIGAVGGDGVDLIRGVTRCDEAVRPAAIRSEPDHDDVALTWRGLALDAEDTFADFEGKVIPAMLGHRSQDINSQASSLGGNLELGDVAFEVGIVG